MKVESGKLISKTIRYEGNRITHPLPLGEGAVVDELASRTTAGECNKTISRIGPISPISWLSPLRSLRADEKILLPYGIKVGDDLVACILMHDKSLVI